MPTRVGQISPNPSLASPSLPTTVSVPGNLDRINKERRRQRERAEAVETQYCFRAFSYVRADAGKEGGREEGRKGPHSSTQEERKKAVRLEECLCLSGGIIKRMKGGGGEKRPSFFSHLSLDKMFILDLQ